MMHRRSLMQKSGGVAGPVGVDFDGTNDYLSRSSDLVGNADGKTFTFSCWFYVESATFNQQFAYSSTDGTNTGIQVYIDSGTGAGLSGFIRARNSAGTRICQTVSFYKAQQGWNHVLASVNLALTTGSIYLSDILVGGLSTAINDNIDFTKTTHNIGAEPSASDFLKGRLAGVYLDYTYRDLSVEANRRDFIDADGLYVTPPTSGIISVPMDDPDDVGRNDGTGGDFTLSGTVARSGRGPNQYNAVASEFDGSADRLNRSSQLTGESSTNAVTFNFNIRNLANPVNTELYTAARFGGPRIIFGFKSAFYIEISSDAGIRVRYTFPSAFILNRTYNVSFKLRSDNISLAQFYVNGELIAATTSGTGTDSNFNQGGFSAYSVASQLTTRILKNSVVGTFWYDNVDIDLATENPFYDVETNKPKYLGASGELPTGSSPLIYLPLRADDAGNNLGTGGDFTVNSGPYVGARGASEFLARSAEFNGTNQHLDRTTALSGATTSKLVSFSYSVKFDANEGYQIGFSNGSQLNFGILNSVGKIRIIGRQNSANAVINVIGSTTLSTGVWYNICGCFDMANTGSKYLYINNAAETLAVTDYVDDTLNFVEPLEVAASGFGSGRHNGNIGFLWFNTEYIDFSQEANRLKFFDAFDYPVDLGADGSVPTGNQPLIYMNNDIHLGTNLGSGGDFTPINSPTAGSDVKG